MPSARPVTYCTPNRFVPVGVIQPGACEKLGLRADAIRHYGWTLGVSHKKKGLKEMTSNQLEKVAAANQKDGGTLKRAFEHGDVWVKLSFLVMGLGNLAAGQLVKGLIFLAVEAGYIVFMAAPMGGAYWLSMLPSLGWRETEEVWNDDLFVYEYVQGDNSQQILLYAVATLVITVLFITIWRASVRSGFLASCKKAQGAHVNTFAEDVRSLFDLNIHKLLMTPPFILLVAFTVTPLIYMMLMAFTNYSKTDSHLILFDWVGLKNFGDLFNSTSVIGRQFWGVLGWTITWAFFATFLNFFFGMFVAMIIGAVVGLLVAHPILMAQRDITNIRVELVRVGVAIPVGFIGTDGMFIPFTGEHTLPANSFKAMANAADTGKEIDKSKGIIRMRSRRTRQQVAQITELAVAQAVPCPVAYQQPLEYRRAPVTLAMGHQLVCQRFSIIHFQQLTQECLHGCR